MSQPRDNASGHGSIRNDRGDNVNASDAGSVRGGNDNVLANMDALRQLLRNVDIDELMNPTLGQNAQIGDAQNAPNVPNAQVDHMLQNMPQPIQQQNVMHNAPSPEFVLCDWKMSCQGGESKHKTEGCEEEEKKKAGEYDYDPWSEYFDRLLFYKKARIAFLKEAISYYQLRGKYPLDDKSAMEDFLENFIGVDLSADEAYFCPEDVIELVEEHYMYDYREMNEEEINGEKDKWNEDEVKFYELTSQIWGNDDPWWSTYADCLSYDRKEHINFFKEAIAYQQLHGKYLLADELHMEEFLVDYLRVDSCAENVMVLVEEKFKRDFKGMKEADMSGEENKYWDEDKVKLYELTSQIWGNDG